MCGYTLGLRSVEYCLWVTVALTSGLNSKKKWVFGCICHIVTHFLLFTGDHLGIADVSYDLTGSMLANIVTQEDTYVIEVPVPLFLPFRTPFR